MLADLDHVVLASRDVDASLEFYLDVLGLEAYRVDLFRRGGAFFPCARLNTHTILDILPPAMWSPTGVGPDEGVVDEGAAGGFRNVPHFCLAVSAADWEPLLGRLASAGVEVESGPMILHGARGDATSIYVRDPDGNQVELRSYGVATVD